ncbi:MAG: hypothetical protein HYV09_23090 [Deltaproteobacteria bacterium]|nr:hypothetical protein [Deltaproteobacteria bacterium]
MTRVACLTLLLACVLWPGTGCAKADAKPNCNKMRACCTALKGVENGLPQEHEILCHHDPELDEGCVETIADIAKFTPSKTLPAVCR